MKKIKELKLSFETKCFMAASAFLAAGGPKASAIQEYTNLTVKDAADKMNTMFSDAGSAVINVVTVLVGLLGAVMLGWNIYKSQKGDPQSSDALLNWTVRTVVAIGLLQLVRIIFFKQG